MKQSNKETYWSQFVPEYEEKQGYVAGTEILALAREELWKEQMLGSVLELGCGTGLYTKTLNENAKHIVASDFSDEMIRAAKQKMTGYKDITFEKADALNLHFDDKTFDTVFMANLIHIIGDADRVIKQSKRVLKVGGQLIITSFAVDEMSFFRKIALVIRYLKAFGKPSKESTKEKTSKKRIEILLLNNGFEISKTIVLGKTMKAIYIRGVKK